MRKNLTRARNGVLCKRKRGSVVLDVLIGAVLFLGFAMIMVFGYKILSELNADLQADTDLSPSAKGASQSVTNNYPAFMDNAFLLLLVLFWIFILVTSFFIDTYPVFFVISLVLLVFVFVVGMNLANTYEEVMADDEMINYAASFPKTNWVMSHFLIIIMAIGFSAALALYANSKVGGGGL